MKYRYEANCSFFFMHTWWHTVINQALPWQLPMLLPMTEAGQSEERHLQKTCA